MRLQTAGQGEQGEQGEQGVQGVQAVETTAVSQAFGWDEADAFTQHDVQELLRVLFDALEAELKGTPQAEVLRALYTGELSDYVQCRSCLTESSTPQAIVSIAIVSIAIASIAVASVA